MDITPYAIGLGALVALWLVYGVLTRKWSPGELYKGADGRSSSSKLQWLLWTAVVIFSYVSICAARAIKGYVEPISTVPTNVLIAMGLSTTTMIVSKGISTSYSNSGKFIKSKVASGAGIFLDDDGAPALSKIQMMAWTFIAIAVYLIRVGNLIRTSADRGLPAQLPDIDETLMLLMGLGQAGFLGKKLTTTTQTRLTGLTPGCGPAGAEITVKGTGLGKEQNSNSITIDGDACYPEKIEWKDNAIKFTLPRTKADGGNWTPGQRIEIGATIDGHESVNRLPFTIQPIPRLAGFAAGRAEPGAEIAFTGNSFGAKRADSVLTINNVPFDPEDVNWTDTAVKFRLPAKRPDGSDWHAGEQVMIGMIVGDQPSANRLTLTIEK